MSRTRRRKSYRRWCDKEDTSHRRASVRQWRSRCRQRIRECRYDEMPIFKGTEGWLTW